MWYLQLRQFLGLIFTPPESNRSYDQVGTPEDILRNQSDGPPTILSDQVYRFPCHNILTKSDTSYFG